MIWLKVKLQTAVLLLREADNIAKQYRQVSHRIASEGTIQMVEQMTKLRQSISNRIKELGYFYEQNCMDHRSKIILKAKLNLVSLLDPVETATIWFKADKNPLNEIKSSRSLSKFSTNAQPYRTVQNKTPTKPCNQHNITKQSSRNSISSQFVKEQQKETRTFKKQDPVKKPSFLKSTNRNKTQMTQPVEETVITIRMSKEEYQQLMNSMKPVM